MIRFAVVAFVVAIALTGCGGQLDTTYAAEKPGSVDGASVLFSRLAQRTRLRQASQLHPRLAEGCELIVHLADAPALPSAEACTWIRDWLEAADGRQAVLILRGESPAPLLCRRWAAEARAEAARLGGPVGADLTGLAGRLDRAASAADPPVWPAPGKDGRLTCPLFSLLPAPGQAATGFAFGPEPMARAPYTLRAGPRIEALDAVPLIRTTLADGRVVPWAVAVTFGSSRLIVAVNASPLLDGALPDAQARVLLGGLIDAVAGWPERKEPPAAVWLGSLRVRAGEPEATNPLTMAFTRWPLALASWHLLALVVLWLLARAWWLGRRETPHDGRNASFGAHVDALADQLAGERQHQAAARAIARAHGLPAPPHLRDADAARAWLTARSADAPEENR